MQTIDYSFLAIYFVIVFAIGWWASRRNRGGDSRNYFLAGGSVGWVAIGASLFASNISSEHFIGLCGSGAQGLLVEGQYEWLACFILLILGWLFVPFYIKTGVFTMPEFLERRYNAQCRTYLSAISLVAYVLTKISVAAYAGALLLEQLLGIGMWTGAVTVIIATGVYTVFGGLRAVIYTDFFQCFVLVGGGIVLTWLALDHPDVGGVEGLLANTNPEVFNLWKPASDSTYPWTAILFGAPILGVWYWCTDQMIVQRTLAAGNVEAARRSTILAAYMKILPVFILVLPGVAGAMIYPHLAGATDSNQMYATMVEGLLPPGIKGLVVAALLAALMSSLSSTFNSSSTLFTMDFYKKYRTAAGDRELVFVGQIATLVLVIFGLICLPLIEALGTGLFTYLQQIQGYISPPIAAVFLLGITWKRVNGKGAFAALLTGFALGVLCFATALMEKNGTLTDGLLYDFAQIHFLHQAIIMFLASVVVLVVVSLATDPPTDEKLHVFVQRDTVETGAEPKGNGINIALTAVLVGIILSLWYVFSGNVLGGQSDQPTAVEIHAKWHSAPGATAVIDIRSETVRADDGVVEGIESVPYVLHHKDEATHKNVAALNADFIAQITSRHRPNDALLLLGIDGIKQAPRAARALADAGFTSVKYIVGGYSGDGAHAGWKSLPAAPQ